MTFVLNFQGEVGQNNMYLRRTVMKHSIFKLTQNHSVKIYREKL